MKNFYDDNLRVLVDYFESGCKPEKEFSLGVEIEHFIASPAGNASYEQVVEGIKCLAGPDEQLLMVEGFVMGLVTDEYVITLEPASQLEISIFARKNVEDIRQVYREFRKRIDYIYGMMGYQVYTVSYQPYRSVDELELIPKQRYRCMEAYFNNMGSMGKYMMKGTASTQVCIDYSCEEDFVRKYRYGVLLSPLLGLYSENGRVFEKEEYRKHLLRNYIWSNVDRARCSNVPGCFEDDFGFGKYAEYIYNMPMIIAYRQGEYVDVGSKSAAKVYADSLINKSETEHILSMCFADVRLKRYLELRMGDSLDCDRMCDYVRLIKNLFYTRKGMELYDTSLAEYSQKDIDDAKGQITAYGADGICYGKKAGEWMDILNEYKGY